MLVITLMCKHIVCWSGGEDSTATVILAHEHGEPIDEIIFAEVMYDKVRDISGEHPMQMEFVHKAKFIFESWGYKVNIIRAEKDYLDIFYHTIDNPTKHEEHRGKYYGFPQSRSCSIKRDCKERPIGRYLRDIGPYVSYVGICSDEKRRLVSLSNSDKFGLQKKVSLLQKYGYTKSMTGPLCEQYGLRSPIYQYTRRGGCWFCPNAKAREHRSLYEQYPELYREFVALEHTPNIAFDKWNPFMETLTERLGEIE